jgi:hypothetical protein
MRFVIVLAPEAVEDLNRLKATGRATLRTALENASEARAEEGQS